MHSLTQDCTRLHSLQMMIRKYKRLTESSHIHVVLGQEECNDTPIKKEAEYIMIKFDEVTAENTQEHSLRWQQISGHPYRILIFAGSGSEKTNALFHLINHLTVIIKSFCMSSIHTN